MNMKFAMVFEAVDRATKVISRINRSLDRVNKAGAQIGKGFGNLKKGATLAVGAMATVYGGAALAAGAMTGTASEFERFQTILETTEGSSAKAKKAMDWVQKFAVKTPYELSEVTDGFVKLRSYGLDPTSGLMQTLGDTSAAMGKPLMQGVEAIADAVTGENERLKEFGITASKTGNTITYEYTNAAGKTERAMVKAGDRMGIQMKPMEIWNFKYAGSMDRLSLMWDGMVGNLLDQWTKFQMMIMDAGLFDWMKGKLGQVLNKINDREANGTLQQWASKIGNNIQTALEQAWEFGSRAVEVVSEFSDYLKKASDYVGGWENLAAIIAGLVFAPTLIATAVGIMQIVSGVWALGAALVGFTGGGALAVILAGIMKVGTAIKAVGAMALANPLILAIAVIAGAAYLIYRNWDKLGPFFSELWNRITTALQSAWEGIEQTIKSVWDGVKNTINGVWEWIQDKFSWHPANIIYENWNDITQTISNVLSGVKTEAGKVWEGIKSLFDWSPTEAIGNAFSGIGETISSAIGKATETAGSAWRGIKGIFSSDSAVDVAARDPASIERALSATGELKTTLEAVNNVDTSRVSGAINRLMDEANSILSGVKSAIGKAQSFLANQSFHHHGVRLMETLAQGMAAGSQTVVNQIKATMQTVRDHLPSSPAKIGPLSDLHRLKFGETIAGSINATPMVKAMRAATAATMLAALPNGASAATAKVGAALSARSEPALTGTGGSGTTVVNMTYAPVIKVSGKNEIDNTALMEQLRSHGRELKKIFDEQVRLEGRRTY